MIFDKNERRGYARYDTDLKISFQAHFDLKTKIDFYLKKGTEISPKANSAIGHNVNVEGLGFTSAVKLNKDDFLLMDVFVPNVSSPIAMEGRVIWCESISKFQQPEKYACGVRILNVKGESVEKSIIFDAIYQIQWSIVLESVFGTFKDNIFKIKRNGMHL